MNENIEKEIKVEDFNFICRVCLQMGENMTDIFSSGLENKIMEVTSLKMEIDDKLPKSLCSKCSQQINELFIFLQQAKSSDLYLKTLLFNNKSDCTKSKFKTTEKKNCKKILRKKRHKRQQKNSKIIKEIKNDVENDKMYLIFVPEDNTCDSKSESDIIIKDLNSECDSLELSNYCRTLVKSYFSDHTYPKEKRSVLNKEIHQIKNFKLDCFLGPRHDSNKIYSVNLFIHKCSQCSATFDEYDDLTAHFSTHDMQLSILKSKFNCPICDFSIEEKSIFMNHLRAHKEEGFSFVKVNGANEIIPLMGSENDIFIESFTKNCNVFCVNLNSLTCNGCSENLESKDNILSHLESCFSKEKSDIKFCINYVCPICYKLFTDNMEKFTEHLSFHKGKNCYFIKVDNKGEPIQLEENEQLFVPFEEAVNIFSKEKTIFKIIDVNSCDKCNFSSEFFNELAEHCSYIHSENITPDISFCCPICREESKDGSVEEKQAKFYEHLYIHKNEGICFILVKKTGIMADYNEKYSEIFTQSLFLWSFINSGTVLFQNISPELVILDPEKMSGKYTCDVCKKQFEKKHDVVAHIKGHQTQEMLQDSVNFICEKCGKKCSGKLNYKKHFLNHSKSLSANRCSVCTICKKMFANKTTLNDHMRHHAKDGLENECFISSFKIICEKCGKSFSNSSSLTKHKKMHAKEKENNVLKCEICDRDFFRQSSFEKHKSAHLNPKYFECGTCRLPLPSVTSLQKHSEVHKNGSNTFDCRACKLSFLTKDSLTAHQTHTGHYLDRQPLECNVCHEKFFIGRKFTQHIKTHPKYKMGECTLCGKRLSTIQSLMLHMGRHFESNSILCPHCGKQFFEEKNYHRHLLTHEGIKPFSCDTEGCKKSFYTLFELNRHKKYHNNTRDFRCLYCSKSFHEANHLTVHVRTHTGERPYICPHCNKGFVTRTHCKHHIKLMHQEEMNSHSDKELDTSNADRGVWLVKVPKYVAAKWEKAPGNIEVGKLKICKLPGQKVQVELSLTDSVLNLKEPGEENIPRDHRLDVLPVEHLTLGVFSHTAASNLDGVVPENEKLSMEGRIIQKSECRPYADNTYMKLKIETIRKASLPVRQVKQLDRVVQNYKPISDHKNNILYSEKKKNEGKKARDDKEAVLNMLFAAFEKHQYYNIRDLVKITNQPIVYLKEILNEVCNYNIKNPHKNMWELKPEYRHYKETEGANE